MTINEIIEYYSAEDVAYILEKYRVKDENALVIALKIALKIERQHKLRESIDKNKRIELLKKIRNQYGFPIWLINEALKYYNNDEKKAIERLKEIYCAAGDHPDIYIKRSIEKFMKEIKHQKAEDKIDEIRLYLNNNLHPLVSPNNWQVYSDLVDMIDELGELIEENG